MLIVIDIQEYYIDEFQKQKEKYERMIAGIRKRIQQAIEIDEVVINQTCFDDGFTLPEVIELIKLSNNHYFLGKDTQDGSSSIHGFLQRKQIVVDDIELCGCFRDVCVLKTWKGLKNLNYSVLPINKEITLATSTNWRGIETYPDGYLEDNMFTSEQDNKKQLEEAIGTCLPEEDEIVITEDGKIIVDEEGPIRPEELGTPIGDSILCGC